MSMTNIRLKDEIDSSDDDIGVTLTPGNYDAPYLADESTAVVEIDDNISTTVQRPNLADSGYC